MAYTYTVKDLITNEVHENLSCTEVTELTGIPKKRISVSSTPGRVSRDRYIVSKKGEEYLELVDVRKKIGMRIPEDLDKGWEEMRKAAELLKSGKGRIVTKWENGKRVKYTEVRK